MMNACPDALRRIYIDEMERQAKKNSHPRLLIRKDTRNKRSQMKRIRPEMENRLLQDWYAVHSKLNHKGYREFYSKILFCLNKKTVSELNADSFLELIADRRFLFLDYNESYGMAEYPPLSEIVHSSQSYLSTDPDKKESGAVYKAQLEEDAETVLRQVFVPTSGHKAAWEEWNVHLNELKNAYQLQQMLAQSYTRASETLSIRIEPILQLPFEKDLEELCQLFRRYVEACYEYAYAEDLKDLLKEELYRSNIQYVYRYLNEHHPKERVLHVLVFFHLFSQQTRRVAAGKLRSYTCSPLKPSAAKRQKPSAVQSTIRTRTECNVKLFDYLVELVLFKGDENRSRQAREQEYAALDHFENTKKVPILSAAKYRFFLFAKYDQYCHYDLRNMYEYDAKIKGVKLKIDFHCKENQKDGVNLFENLLRYNIRYTMPNQVQWLQKFLTQLNPEPILATLLLDEAQIMPTRERLPDRIRLQIKSGREENMVDKYEEHFLNQEAIREDLKEWCEKFGLYFRHGDAIYERELGRNSLEAKAAAQCGQMVLDYELRAELIRRAEENLLERANVLFGDMLQLESKKTH